MLICLWEGGEEGEIKENRRHEVGNQVGLLYTYLLRMVQG